MEAPNSLAATYRSHGQQHQIAPMYHLPSSSSSISRDSTKDHHRQTAVAKPNDTDQTNIPANAAQKANTQQKQLRQHIATKQTYSNNLILPYPPSTNPRKSPENANTCRSSASHPASPSRNPVQSSPRSPPPYLSDAPSRQNSSSLLPYSLNVELNMPQI